ncbi:hypothetical protein GCM10009780_75780 [Actinomadura alba]
MNSEPVARVRASENVTAGARDGRRARKQAPRRAAAYWDPQRPSHEKAIDRLRAQEAVRDPGR